MTQQVLGLLQPTRRPADLDTILAGSPGQDFMTQPYQGQQPLQVAGLFPSSASPAATTGSGFGQDAGAAAFSGLAAAQAGGTSYDGQSAAINIATGAASGAAAGTAILPGWGTAIGAVAGGGLAALQAWSDVSAENERQAKTDALIRELKEKEQRKERLARSDALSQLKYDRKQAELQKAWGMAQAQRDNILRLINGNSTLRERYLQTGTLSRYN